MNFDLAIAVLLMCSSACYFALGMRLITAKRDVGTMPIEILFLIASIWVLGGAIELVAPSFNVFSIGRTMHFVGTALLPISAYFCFREYTGRNTSIHRLTLLLIIPFVSIALAATNYFHEFMWYLPIANEAGQYLTRPEQWGPWFLFVHAPYSYVVIGVAMLTLLTHTSAVARAHRRGLFLLVAACIGPLTATLAYDIGFGPDTVSFVPIVFTVMLPIYALHRNHLLWEDPDAFKPERFADRKSIDRFAYLPFGDGPRVCIGASFALQEAAARCR